ISGRPEQRAVETLAAYRADQAFDEETDPALVTMQIDIGWVYTAGVDPITLFKKYPSCVHEHSARSRSSPRHLARSSPVGGRRADVVKDDLSGIWETADDHPHDDHGPPSAALRQPASGSHPTHRGRHHRHQSRRPALDGPWMASQGTAGRRQLGRDK